mmetsp:Transcript_21233/g.39322  ORF Transcript_21233/g.39322 Transcript_21233/m.39322 type:complete len:235 (-) Transcript_21233:31-735(-)
MPVDRRSLRSQLQLSRGFVPSSRNFRHERSCRKVDEHGQPSETHAQHINFAVKKVFADYQGPSLEWAVFPAGTVIMVPASVATTENKLLAVARDVLGRNGPICPGTPSGDFNPMRPTQYLGEACAEWFVFFTMDGDFPEGTALFGVHISSGEHESALHIGLQQRAARERDSHDLQVACTSFQLVWSPETHAKFPRASRELARLMLLVQQRRARSDQAFVSHEVLVKFLLPILVQ